MNILLGEIKNQSFLLVFTVKLLMIEVVYKIYVVNDGTVYPAGNK